MIRLDASLVLWASINQNLAHQLAKNVLWDIELDEKELMTSLNAKVCIVYSMHSLFRKKCISIIAHLYTTSFLYLDILFTT